MLLVDKLYGRYGVYFAAYAKPPADLLVRTEDV